MFYFSGRMTSDPALSTALAATSKSLRGQTSTHSFLLKLKLSSISHPRRIPCAPSGVVLLNARVDAEINLVQLPQRCH
jgi:hypothetical protein